MRPDLDLPVPDLAALDPVHLIGVGGAGMSGIALLLARRGLAVSGSDARDSRSLAVLRGQGIAVHVGHDPGRLDGVRAVVVSSAVRESNPELARARADGLLVLHRSQALAALAAGRRVTAVAGTNGKTTTTAMLTAVLRHAAASPSYSIGGELIATGTNAGAGQGEDFVLEADESDGSFVVYHPDVAVVTNVQADHLDHYHDAAGVQRGFEEFVRSIRHGGVLVSSADDEGAARLTGPAVEHGLRVVTFGEADGADVRVSDLRLEAGTALRLTVAGPEPSAVTHEVRLGVPGAQPPAGVDTYPAPRRRFEARGRAGGVQVFDDYAHNPAKVAAAVQTGRQVVGTGGRLVVLFQPHRFSRTRDFADQFGAALGGADEVLVMDVYAAREDPLPGVSGELVSRAVPLPADRVRFLPGALGVDGVVDAVCARVRPGDVLLTVGAGDVTALAGLVLGRLGQGDGTATDGAS
jgi:UDP-N-acetylmuramate--alanine ligase